MKGWGTVLLLAPLVQAEYARSVLEAEVVADCADRCTFTHFCKRQFFFARLCMCVNFRPEPQHMYHAFICLNASGVFIRQDRKDKIVMSV